MCALIALCSLKLSALRSAGKRGDCSVWGLASTGLYFYISQPWGKAAQQGRKSSPGAWASKNSPERALKLYVCVPNRGRMGRAWQDMDEGIPCFPEHPADPRADRAHLPEILKSRNSGKFRAPLPNVLYFGRVVALLISKQLEMLKVAMPGFPSFKTNQLSRPDKNRNRR